MYLLTVVINNEEILDELLTGWLDIGITGSTIIESTGALQLISHHVPIFAGFRSLTSGGMRHNRTIFTVIDDKEILDLAVLFLETLCKDTGKSHQGIYYVTPVTSFEHLGQSEDTASKE